MLTVKHTTMKKYNPRQQST